MNINTAIANGRASVNRAVKFHIVDHKFKSHNAKNYFFDFCLQLINLSELSLNIVTYTKNEWCNKIIS